MRRKPQPRELFTPGQRVTVTNHYITRQDHPCFGTRLRTVVKVTGSSVWFDTGGRVEWPRRKEQIFGDNDKVTLLGGGAGQKPDELFLTINLQPQETA